MLIWLTLKMWKIASGWKLEIVQIKWRSNDQKEKMLTKYVNLKRIENIEFGLDGHT